MMKPGSRKGIIAAMVALFALSVVMANNLAVKHRDYMQTPDTSTPFQALAPALLGFREVAASLLWVKTDDYFHRGEYEPILRLVRLITVIDPHQIDVYTTGAWHMSYNFMDKRLIKTGLEFLEGGVKNNPSIYDLYFESGYTNMDKTRDFPKAIYWYREASNRGTTDGKPMPPMFTWFQLAHAHERAGDIDGAIQQWQINLNRAAKEVKEKATGPVSTAKLDAAAQHLLALDRQGEGVPEDAWVASLGQLHDGARELKGKSTDFARGTNLDVSVQNFYLAVWRKAHRRHLGDQPLPANLDVKVTKLAPRKIRIEGTCNVLDLSRVTVMFRDKNWEQLDRLPDEQRMKKLTMEWDNPSVRGSHFKWDLNLNRDPADMGRDPWTIYPLTSDEYEVTVTFNPRTQAPFIQDVYGWSGEGITDPKDLTTDPSRAGTVAGKRVPLRLIQKRIILKRSDVV
jgi:hypothetical protein